MDLSEESRKSEIDIYSFVRCRELTSRFLYRLDIGVTFQIQQRLRSRSVYPLTKLFSQSITTLRLGFDKIYHLIRSFPSFLNLWDNLV